MMGVYGKVLTCLLAAAVCAPAVDFDLLRLAMPDARVVSGISVTQAKTSPFGQFLLSQISSEQEKELAAFLAVTGFDVRRDLQEVLVAAPGGPGNQRRLVLARGSFDPARIIELAKTVGAEATPYQGVEVLSGGKKQRMSLAFLDASTAIAGDPESVRGAIDRRQSGVTLDPKLSAKIKELRSALDAWFVSLVPLSEFAGRVPDSSVSGALKGDVVKSIDQASGGVKFGDLVEISTEIVARTAQDASTLADVVRFLAGLVQLNQQNPQIAQLSSALDTLDIKTSGNTVKFTLAIAEAQLETIFLSSHQNKQTPRPAP